jgi:hypothetical protein
MKARDLDKAFDAGRSAEMVLQWQKARRLNAEIKQ